MVNFLGPSNINFDQHSGQMFEMSRKAIRMGSHISKCSSSGQISIGGRLFLKFSHML